MLDLVSQPNQLLRALDHLPPTMQDIYDDIIQRINGSIAGDQDLALKALSWVFHTANHTGSRPLSMDEILDLVATEIGEDPFPDGLKSSSDNLLNACRGLLIVDTVANTVRFAHLTVLEYFRTKNVLRPLSYVVRISMTYLSSTEFETECAGDDYDWSAVGSRLEKCKAGGFLSEYWAYYARGAQGDEVVQECIFGWLNSEARCRSMIQMLFYHDAVKGPDEVWYGWDWLLWKQRCQSVLRLLVNNGLDVLCELFLDGKTSINKGYI